MAAVRKEESLAIGNLLGSNIFNVLAVLGITSLVTDLPVGDAKIYTKDIWMMLGFVLLLYPVMRVYSKRAINRLEGSHRRWHTLLISIFCSRILEHKKGIQLDAFLSVCCKLNLC